MMNVPVITDAQGQQIEIFPGLYFGMPEDQYHAIPALSSTGFKNLLVSAPDFYFNSWLNPMRDEDAEDEDSREWKVFGRASHTRILEGKKVFDTLYCIEFLPPEGCLKTKDDLKKALDDLGVPSQSKWKKEDFIKAVLAANPNAMIYEVEEEKYYRETNGRKQLSAKDMRRIEIAAAMIEKHPELCDFFQGGYPEVTVIWEEGGFWFKARFDYLKPAAIVDLKTFTNRIGKPIDDTLYEAMASLKYHIQAVHYSNGMTKAVEFARRGLINIFSHRHRPADEFIQLLASQTQMPEFWFCFQKKGGAPLARGMQFHFSTSMFKCGVASIEQAIAQFARYYEVFGTDIWVDATPVGKFEDHLFPVWATKI